MEARSSGEASWVFAAGLLNIRRLDLFISLPCVLGRAGCCLVEVVKLVRGTLDFRDRLRVERDCGFVWLCSAPWLVSPDPPDLPVRLDLLRRLLPPPKSLCRAGLAVSLLWRSIVEVLDKEEPLELLKGPEAFSPTPLRPLARPGFSLGCLFRAPVLNFSALDFEVVLLELSSEF